ncbi:MAG: hypothetical protein PHC28_07840 [Flavobacterium sp.]|uniref:hypothetical protein n=1 Tax=Flavobacterium sp. TaxID=239 RepID=UPI0026373A4A|nr:hypothetical protein [Flavobacterium sp.]MDD5150383.1 hypothetical protein [Flavobacterium sp.]
MAISPYFNHLHSKAEQSLYRSLTRENLRISGILVYYIPRTDELKDSTPLANNITLSDNILKESVKTSFLSNYQIEVYFKNVGGDGGEGDIMSKFGFAQMLTSIYVMSKDSFEELNIPLRNRPREGDLLYVGDMVDDPIANGSFTNNLFEITHVTKDTNNFWPTGKYFVYELTCQLYTHGYEKFQTGNAAIDAMVPQNTNDIDVALGINTAVKNKENTLIDFSQNNPFGGI